MHIRESCWVQIKYLVQVNYKTTPHLLLTGKLERVVTLAAGIFLSFYKDFIIFVNHAILSYKTRHTGFRLQD